MYEETRSHVRAQAHFAGASVTVLALTLTGYGLVTGLAAPIFDSLPKPLQAVVLPKPPIDEVIVPPVTDDIVLDLLKTPFPTPPLPDDLWREAPDERRIVTGPAEAEPGPSVIGPAAPVTPRPPLPPVAPKLMAKETPPYPPADIRARNEGVTGLSLCLDARGRVSSAALASSSGHRRLDEAALKWIRSARFSPATQDGAPVPVCDFPVDYEWRLEDAR